MGGQCGETQIGRTVPSAIRYLNFSLAKSAPTTQLSPGCQAVRCCQVICRAVGQLSGTVRCLCQTSCQVLSVLSGAVGCLSDTRGAP